MREKDELKYTGGTGEIRIQVPGSYNIKNRRPSMGEQIQNFFKAKLSDDNNKKSQENLVDHLKKPSTDRKHSITNFLKSPMRSHRRHSVTTYITPPTPECTRKGGEASDPKVALSPRLKAKKSFGFENSKLNKVICQG